eukprot:9483748-Pyramimonas_sp.AAC.1
MESLAAPSADSVASKAAAAKPGPPVQAKSSAAYDPGVGRPPPPSRKAAPPPPPPAQAQPPAQGPQEADPAVGEGLKDFLTMMFSNQTRTMEAELESFKEETRTLVREEVAPVRDSVNNVARDVEEMKRKQLEQEKAITKLQNQNLDPAR